MDVSEYRDNRDHCVECDELVGSNPNCENCFRVRNPTPKLTAEDQSVLGLIKRVRVKAFEEAAEVATKRQQQHERAMKLNLKRAERDLHKSRAVRLGGDARLRRERTAYFEDKASEAGIIASEILALAKEKPDGSE